MFNREVVDRFVTVLTMDLCYSRTASALHVTRRLTCSQKLRGCQETFMKKDLKAVKITMSMKISFRVSCIKVSSGFALKQISDSFPKLHYLEMIRQTSEIL